MKILSEDEFWEFDRETAEQQDAWDQKMQAEQRKRILTFGRCCRHSLEWHTHAHERTYCGHPLCECRGWKPRRWWNQ